jgi:outer membrane protein OmpA-like peptidoglycan-associated protein
MIRERSWKSVMVPVLSLGLLIGVTTAGAAQAADTARSPKPLKWGTGAWMFNAYVGQFNDEPEWQPDHRADQLRRDALFGGRIGYNFPFNLFIQAEASNSLIQTRIYTTDQIRNTNLFLLGGALGYNIQPMQNLQVFPVVGLGAAIFKPKALASETDFTVEYGGGFRYFMSPKLALRGDIRWHQVPNAMQDIRDRLAGTSVPHPTLWGLELSGGLSLFVGGPSDSDRDNVDDAQDACPDTPRGYPVDLRGCPLDDDSDGVPNAIDQCPGTQQGAIVDSKGCGLDTDGDGVPNGIDQCPATPHGATVDARGCPSDSDADGVYDGIDQCPSTPKGATVDAKGCPSDSDADGVYDGIDQCPDTPSGQAVDDRGCPPGLIILKNVPVRLDQLGVYFDFNRATLRPGSSTALDLVGQALSQMPDVEIEVQGYADAVGSQAYNLRLSRQRAETVRDYLVQHFPKLDASRFTVKAFGESNPAASNATREGRDQNRRVILVAG